MKKVLIFTFNRSEYGLLSPLIQEFKESSDFEVALAVGGAHLVQEFGMSVEEIKKDGFEINKTLPFLVFKNESVDPTLSLGKLLEQIPDYIKGVKPDGVLVLGDRYELLAVGAACLMLNVPLIHISGGEITEGAIDNQVRHALSKIANLHYPANETYASNLRKMGEEAWRICASGEPGLDKILKVPLIDRGELSDLLKLNQDKKIVSVTFHSDTLRKEIGLEFIGNIFQEFQRMADFQFVASAANPDLDGVKINTLLEKLALGSSNIKFVPNLGQQKYYSLLKHSSLMIGNSSSGLVEAQSFNLPAINVGDRQKGRLQNLNVYDVPAEVSNILKAIPFVLSDEFRLRFSGKQNIYGDGKACKKILSHIKNNIERSDLLLKKTVFGA